MDRVTGFLQASRWRARAASVVAGALLAPALWPLLGAGSAAPRTFSLGPWRLMLEEPRWLLLLLAVPFIALVTLTSQATEPARLLPALAVGRSLVLAALAAGLAQPAAERLGREVSAVVLTDVSASVGDRALEVQRGFVERTRAEAARRSPMPSLRAVRFAARPVEAPLTAPAERFPAGEPRETDLALGLGLGLGLLEPGKVPRLLVLSDGLATKGEALREAERAGERGARIFFHLAPGAEADDIAVAALGGPDSVRAGASFDLEISVLSTAAGQARLTLSQDGKPHRPEAERTVTLQAGLTEVRWPTRVADNSPTLYQVKVAAAAGNAHPENDDGLLAVAPEAVPRALVVEGRAGNAEGLRRALKAEQIESDVVARTALPDEARLGAYDLVVLSDVARGALREADMQALEHYVRERGGGLLVSAGPESFGAGVYQGTRLEGLLPVAHELTDEKQEATLALGLVIDRSGSMSGPKMELTKEAARGTAEMLGPLDLITVVVFDSQAQTVVRLQPAANRQRILGDIAQIRASGGTNILPGLREAFEQLLTARARKKHVIVLSDGQSPTEGIQEIVDEAAAARITVSAVGVGEGADLAVLQSIASRGGGRFYQTRDPASIPRIFTRETAQFSRSAIVEEPTAVTAGKAAEALGGLAFADAPPLRGYARTRARKEAEVLLLTRQGDPLLARWQQGLGQALVWTSDLGARWAVDWLRWGAWSKLWGQVARSAMRKQAANRLPLRATLRGDRVLVAIDALDAGERPLEGLAGELEVTDVRGAGALPAQPTRRLALHERSPGRYEAELPADGARALLFHARLASAASRLPVGEAQGRLGVPASREQLPAVRAGQDEGELDGRALLEALAARTGGRELGADPAAFLDAGPDTVVTLTPLRAPLLLAGVLVFLAELAGRRAKFRRPGREEAGTQAGTRAG
jgi:uncharacterized membrane protein/Mg-chelatase subunit ChlD